MRIYNRVIGRGRKWGETGKTFLRKTYLTETIRTELELNWAKGEELQGIRKDECETLRIGRASIFVT